MTNKKEEIEKELESAPDLQCMPFIATEIIRLVDDPQTSSRELRSLISTDASLTGRVLKLVNSAQFAMTRKVSDLADAISLLGFSQVREAVLLASTEVMRSIPAATELFKYNLFVANISKMICKKVDDFKVADAAFVAGLLHGVGKCYYLERFENEYAPLLVKQPGDLAKQELNIYGYPNYKVAQELIKSWALSQDLANAIFNVNNPPQDHSQELDVALYYAALLGRQDPEKDLESEFLLNLKREPLEKVGLRVNDLRDVFKEAHDNFETTMESFNAVMQ